MDKEFEDALRSLIEKHQEDIPDIDYEGIASKFTDFLQEHMPPRTAVVFGFANSPNKIMCVIGGASPNNPIYDALVTKLAGQVDSRRDFDSTATEVIIDHHSED